MDVVDVVRAGGRDGQDVVVPALLVGDVAVPATGHRDAGEGGVDARDGPDRGGVAGVVEGTVEPPRSAPHLSDDVAAGPGPEVLVAGIVDGVGVVTTGLGGVTVRASSLDRGAVRVAARGLRRP